MAPRCARIAVLGALLASAASAAEARTTAEPTPPHVLEVIHRGDATLDIVVDAGIGPTTAVVVSSPVASNRFATTELRESGSLVATVYLTARERRALDAGEPLVIDVQPMTVDFEANTSAVGMTRSFAISGREYIDGLRPDRLLFVFLGMALFGVLWLYRREPDREHRLRLAGAAGLVSVLFLCTTPAMTWTQTGADADGPARCALGDEARCAADAPVAALEHAEWSGAAIRAGHMTIILLLLPACIWLMVAPRSRGAQAMLIGGAAPALFTALATALYAATLGRWSAGAGGAADLTLLACVTLLVVAANAGLVGRRLRGAAPIPTAVVRQQII